METSNRTTLHLHRLTADMTPDERRDFERSVRKLARIRGLGVNLGAEIVAKVYRKVQDMIEEEKS